MQVDFSHWFIEYNFSQLPFSWIEKLENYLLSFLIPKWKFILYGKRNIHTWLSGDCGGIIKGEKMSSLSSATIEFGSSSLCWRESLCTWLAALVE